MPDTVEAHPAKPNIEVRYDPADKERRVLKVSDPNNPGYVTVTKSELVPDGTQPVTGDTVTIEYTGHLKDLERASGRSETPFDSSVGRGDFSTEIGIGRVIKGWDYGVTLMRKGEKATLEIDPEWAYGPKGFGSVIPANSTLIFDVYLKDVTKSTV